MSVVRKFFRSSLISCEVARSEVLRRACHPIACRIGKLFRSRSLAVMASNSDRAGGAFREAFRFDAEAAVETSPKILPSNRRGQFHHLLWIEMLAQAAEQLLRDIGRRPRQCHGVAKDTLFQLGEGRAVFKGGQVGKLLLADSLPSAHGRVEVNSEWAADEHGRLEAGEQLQLGGHRARGR